jgi:hypothetical protein
MGCVIYILSFSQSFYFSFILQVRQGHRPQVQLSEAKAKATYWHSGTLGQPQLGPYEDTTRTSSLACHLALETPFLPLAGQLTGLFPVLDDI